jgi:hypothetical protein
VPRQAPLIPLPTLLQRRFPDLADPARLIADGAVLVNGVPAASMRTRVRADAIVHLRRSTQVNGRGQAHGCPGRLRH